VQEKNLKRKDCVDLSLIYGDVGDNSPHPKDISPVINSQDSNQDCAEPQHSNQDYAPYQERNYEYSPKSPIISNPQNPICVDCGTMATVNCKECSLLYCDKCNIETHSKEKSRRGSHTMFEPVEVVEYENCGNSKCDKAAAVECTECKEVFCLECARLVHKKLGRQLHSKIFKYAPRIQKTNRIIKTNVNLNDIDNIIDAERAALFAEASKKMVDKEQPIFVSHNPPKTPYQANQIAVDKLSKIRQNEYDKFRTNVNLKKKE